MPPFNPAEFATPRKLPIVTCFRILIEVPAEANALRLSIVVMELVVVPVMSVQAPALVPLFGSTTSTKNLPLAPLNWFAVQGVPVTLIVVPEIVSINPCHATGCIKVGEINVNFGDAGVPPETVSVINPTGSVVAVVWAWSAGTKGAMREHRIAAARGRSRGEEVFIARSFWFSSRRFARGNQ